MRTPCETCKYEKLTEVGFRSFIGCLDEERQSKFHYDDFLYNHTCDGYEPKEQCLKCNHYAKPYGNYCNSIVGKDNGVCVDFSEV